MRDGRKLSEIRDINIELDVIEHAFGSCIISFGNTKVLCTATIEEGVPRWRKGSNLAWITAEYSMLPASTHTRTRRERFGAKGRTLEIERLIGRSLRSAVDMGGLGGEVTITIDCDVLSADGGTRCASVTGGYIALVRALQTWEKAGRIKELPLLSQVAAISVGYVDGDLRVDLNYEEDSNAEVDFNLVADDKGRFIEVQGTGEQIAFEREKLDRILDAGSAAIKELVELQREYCGL